MRLVIVAFSSRSLTYFFAAGNPNGFPGNLPRLPHSFGVKFSILSRISLMCCLLKKLTRVSCTTSHSQLRRVYTGGGQAWTERFQERGCGEGVRDAAGGFIHNEATLPRRWGQADPVGTGGRAWRSSTRLNSLPPHPAGPHQPSPPPGHHSATGMIWYAPVLRMGRCVINGFVAMPLFYMNPES